MLEEQRNHLADQYSNEKISAKALYNIAEGSNMDYYPFPTFGEWLGRKGMEQEKQLILARNMIEGL
jgi:hypothetical protein